MRVVNSLFFGQRLFLEKFKASSTDKDEFIISGHGHTIEIYRLYTQMVEAEKPQSSLQYRDFELIFSLEIFPCTKSVVQRVICLDNNALFCVGEQECEILLLQQQQNGNSFDVSRRHNLCFDNWIVGAKCIDGTGVVLHFANNSIKFLKFNDLANIQTNCELNLEGRAVITCSLLDGDTWESLQIFAGTSLGPIYQFRPAISDEKIVQTFLGNNGMSFAIRRYQNWLFSVGDDRALRIWTIQNNGLQIFEKYGHGARPFALELIEKQKMILTGGVDEYLCIWRWTENIDNKMTDINMERRVELGSLGTIQSILPILSNSNSEFFLDLLIASRRGALVNIHLPLFERFISKKLKPFLNFVKPIPHSENITTLALGRSVTNEKNFFLSGSFDRKIVCYSLEQNNVLAIHSSVQMHRSSIETICVLQESDDLNEDIRTCNDETLVLSGGGRSELFCWRLNINENMPELLFSSKLQNKNNTDVRILSVHWIFGKNFALTLCSDATIRISHLNFVSKSISESSRFQLCSMAMFRAMDLSKIIEGTARNCQLLFVVSSSGHLYTFQLSLTSNGTQINSIHDSFLVEKCGLSAISSEFSFDRSLHYILIGSESGSIHILTFDKTLGYPQININENWHASTVTALQIWESSDVLPVETKLIASISLDCRLLIGNYIPIKNKLNCHIKICLSISDPAALIVLPRTTNNGLNEFEMDHAPSRNNSFNCIVSGTGLECIGIF